MKFGIVLNKKIADKVETGDILAYIYANDEEKAREALESLGLVYKLSDKKVKKEQVILGVI